MVQIRDRGYNLMITAVVAFGLPALGEADRSDKIDDIAVLVVGLIALAWYRLGTGRFRRSWVQEVRRKSVAGRRLIAHDSCQLS
jgi:hypothetical protein